MAKGFSPEKCFAVASLLVSASIVGCVLWYCRFGFDITDEGFYLNWISRPFNYPDSSTQFGFLYHPLYVLFGGDVSVLRQFNLLFTFFLGFAAAWALMETDLGSQGSNVLSRIACSAAVASTSLLSTVFLGMWLPSPSYNTLAFQGLLVAAIGLILFGATTERWRVVGSTLLGVGGWLAFMGKPTSAAALAAFSVIFLLLSGRLRISHLAIAVGTALGLLILTALLIDGSIMIFIERSSKGLLMGKALVGEVLTAEIFRLENLVLGEQVRQAMCFLVGIVFLAMWLARLEQGGAVMAALVVALGLLAVFHYTPLLSIPAEHRALLLSSVAAGVALAALSMLRFKDVCRFGWSRLMLFFTLLSLTYAYAFGTGNNYWIPIGAAGAFVVLASLVVLCPLARLPSFGSMLLVAGLSLQVLTVVLVNGAFELPYRQPQPLNKNSSELEVGRVGSKLILSDIHAKYLSSIFDLVAQNGFQRGGPMIDLSGHSPGVLYALGANSIGVAWSLGGYPGTARFVIWGLKSVPCEQVTAAWILSEPKGPRPVPKEVLTSFGADPETDYEIVGTVRSPEGQAQYLSRPVRSVQVAVNACTKARENAI